MALFASKKNKKSTQSPVPSTQKGTDKTNLGTRNSELGTLGFDYVSIIKRPRVTEKASVVSANGVYVFEVTKDSNKNQIAKAIEILYKVTPSKVRVAAIQPKRVFVRGKWGVKSGGKKAYVYLKKGDKIEIA